MANLPIVPGSEVHTPSNGVQMDSTAFRNAALAPGRIGEAVGREVGGLFEDVSQKIQQNRNARMVFEADLAMRKTKDDFTAELVKMPDETTWLPAWKDRVQQVRDNVIDNPHAGPDVKRMLSQKFDVWEAATTAETRTAALLKGVKESKDAGIAAATYAASQGDLQGAMDATKAMVANYAMSEQEAARFSSRFPTIAGQAQADTIITADPIHAPELIQQLKGQIEPKVFVAIEARARDARGAARSANLNNFASQLDDAGAIDPQVLKQAVKDGQITQTGMNNLVRRMEQADQKRFRSEYDDLMADVQDHDWVGDKDRSQSAQDYTEMAAGLPQDLRNRVTRHIQASVTAGKRGGDAEQRPVVKQIFEDMREDRLLNGLTVPSVAKTTPGKTIDDVFGIEKDYIPAKTTYISVDGGLGALRKMDQEDVEKTFGKGVKKEDILKAEQQHYAKVMGQMREWFDDPSNKDATYEEADTYRRSLMKPFVMNAVSAALAPSAAKFEVGKIYKDASGQRKKWDGKEWVNP